MTYKKLVILIIFIFCESMLRVQAQVPYSQILENNTWVFGQNAGLDFSTSLPTAISTNAYEVTSRLGTASISDASGQLLFYSSMDTIRDRFGNIMPNGGGLLTPPPPPPVGGIGRDPTSLIVPFPGNTHKYYVFSLGLSTVGVGGLTTLNLPAGAGRLYYSVVDMTLNGGLGDVVPGQKGIQVDSFLAARLVSVQGANCNIWVLCMKADGSEIHAFDIGYAGIDLSPVISPCSIDFGPPNSHLETSPFFVGASGSIRATSDGNKLAVSLSRVIEDTVTGYVYSGGFELFDFNPAIGIASNQLNIIMPDSSGTYNIPDGVISLCFSPDNTKLYTPHGFIFEYGLYQYDITSGTVSGILASRTELDVMAMMADGMATTLRLGPDNKMYMTTLEYNDKLHCIDSPNVAGTGATLVYNAVTLAPGSYSNFGLGNATVARPPSDTVYNPIFSASICIPDTTAILMPRIPQGTGYSYVWDNGDTTYARTVTYPGRYRVVYWADCHKMVDSFIVEAVDVRFDLGADTAFCNNIDYQLHINVPGATYLWQDGSTGASFSVTKAGQYYATSSLNGCTYSDSIEVQLIDLMQHLGPDTFLCREEPLHVALEANVPSGATVLWNNGSILPVITAIDTGNYWVTVSQLHCMGSDTIYIGTISCDCYFLMPSAFTPNNDGLNDIAIPSVIPVCSIKNYTLSIYNRYGQRVFSTNKPDIGWDGRFSGAQADVGTYFYELHFSGGKRNKSYYQKGDITLIR